MIVNFRPMAPVTGHQAITRSLCCAAICLAGLCGPRAAGDAKQNVVYPADAGVINIKAPPYAARGDGKTDDTLAIQKALDEHTGRGDIIYFPNGVYLVSRSLRLPLHAPNGNTNYGNTHLQGQSRDGAVLRLKDATFTDQARPQAVIDSGPHGSADWFHNSVRNLTIDSGERNPGAIGLRFFSNNTGCVRDVTLRSGDGQGVAGLDLAYNDMNGPLLVQRVTVRGFAVGVKTGHSVNSQTFSDLTVEKQRTCGFINDGQYLAIENFRSRNSVTALRNTAGMIALAGAVMIGQGEARHRAAIENQADLYARNVRTPGYRTAMQSNALSPARPGVTDLNEYSSTPPIRLFPATAQPPTLASRAAPTIPWDAPASWASPRRFGMPPDGEGDAAPAIQAAIDSGSTTVFLPKGTWHIGQTIHLRGKIRRLIGCESTLVPIEPLRGQSAPLFQVDAGTGPVIIERMKTDYAGGPFYFVAQASERSLILSSIAVNFQGADSYRNTGQGPVFIEDMVGGPFHFRKQSVWARQLNQESEGKHIVNEGASVWIVGLKTERGGTLVTTTAGGRTEILGGLCYTTTAGKLAPMFVTENATVSVTLGERCYSGYPYATILQETQQGETRHLPATDTRYAGRLVRYTGATPAKLHQIKKRP